MRATCERRAATCVRGSGNRRTVFVSPRLGVTFIVRTSIVYNIPGYPGAQVQLDLRCSIFLGFMAILWSQSPTSILSEVARHSNAEASAVDEGSNSLPITTTLVVPGERRRCDICRKDKKKVSQGLYLKRSSMLIHAMD